MNLIDPTKERERGRHEPPFWPEWIDTFAASHIVAFGTHWRAHDYREELEQRLANRESLPFGVDEAHYNRLILDLLGDRKEGEAVLHYASSRSLDIPLQQACQMLAEAARRGQVITRARRPAETQSQQLPAHEWSDRERYRFSRSHLFRRGQERLVAIEWEEIQFFAEDVEALRRDGLAPARRPDPISADVLPLVVRDAPAPAPTLKSFQTDPATIRASIGRMEKPNYSRPDLARAVADLFREAGGHQLAADPAGSIVKTWKQLGLDRAALIKLAEKA